MKVLILITAILALALAQGMKPVWPMAASTSLFIHGWEHREDRHFVRFFYDSNLGKERIDGPREFLGEMYWTTTILNTATMREYFIIYQGSLVQCYERASNQSIPHPMFDRARYIGKAEIEYVVLDHWIERDHMGRDHLQIFDRADNGMILRMDFDDGRRPHAVTYQFHEWDVGAQDPNLFMVNSNILAICNSS